MKGKKVLVTGASGFIGACFMRSIADDCDVHLILRKGSDRWRIDDILGKVTVHEGDVTERRKLADIVKSIGPQLIYHFATYGAGHGQREPAGLIGTNLGGTVNLVDACAESGFECFVNIGSSSEYGRKARPMREDDLLEPDSLYGATKAAATHYCRHIAKAKDLPITTFRIFAAYGYYQPKGWLIPTLIASALENRPPRLASADSVRDFIFIEDIIEALKLAPGAPGARGEILNLGTGRQHTVAEAAGLVAELCGSDAKPEWGAVSRERDEPEMWVADMAKTAKALGWRPRFDLRSGLEKDIEWFRRNISHYG